MLLSQFLQTNKEPLSPSFGSPLEETRFKVDFGDPEGQERSKITTSFGAIDKK